MVGPCLAFPFVSEDLLTTTGSVQKRPSITTTSSVSVDVDISLSFVFRRLSFVCLGLCIVFCRCVFYLFLSLSFCLVGVGSRHGQDRENDLLFTLNTGRARTF